MRDIERIEEVKRRVMIKATNREGIPEDVIKVIQEVFDGLSNKYRDLQCNNLSIQEYMEGKFREIEAYVKGNIGERRKENRIGQLQNIFGNIEREIEEEDKNKYLDENRRENRHKQEIMQMKSDENSATTIIMGVLEDTLNDVQARQNNILGAKGLDRKKIEFVQQNVSGFIRYFMAKDEKKVYEILSKDTDALKNEVLMEYEEFLQKNKEAENKENKENKEDKKDEFREELYGNISLEEQRKFAIRKQEEKNEENKENKENSLPDNILE